MLDCLIAHGTPTEPDIFTVNGMATRTYSNPYRTPPNITTAEIQYTTGTVTEVGALPGTISMQTSRFAFRYRFG